MALLDKLLGRRQASSADLRVDEFCGDPAAHEWGDRLERGDWRGLGDFLRAQDNPKARDFYVRVLPDRIKGWPTWFDQWVETEPQDAMARLFRASRSIRYAWEARGRGFANTVNSESWPLFFSRLDAADADLAVAADLIPDDPGSWVLMITTARGRQLGIPEIRQRFAEVERRRPYHAQACQQVLQAVAAKVKGYP